MPVKRDDETFTEFTLRLAREEWTRPMQDEIVRLRAENERLRHGFCDEAHILMVQALDVKALGKGRRAILTEQAVRMAKVGLSKGWPRWEDRSVERRAEDVLALLDSEGDRDA